MTSDDPVLFGSLATTFLLNAGLALSIGAIASLSWSKTHRSAWSAAMRARSLACLRAGSSIALVASAAELWLRSANAADVSPIDAGPAVVAMLAHSHYGRAWAAGTIAVAVLCACAWFGTKRSEPHPAIPIILAACAAIFVLSRSTVSHAAANGDVSIAVAMDSVHLASIALWVGLVLVASVAPFSPLQATGERRDGAAWLRLLSRVATLALIAIAVTGMFNTWRATGGALGGLPGSRYGTILFVKLIFVAASVALGAYNRFRSLPTLLAELDTDLPPDRLKAFVRVIRMEACTLAAALAAAAVLSATEAPAPA